MAFDAFIWFESEAGGLPIPGETQDTAVGANNVIPIAGYSWSSENTTSIGSSGGGAGTGKAKLNPLKFKAGIGKHSPVLFKYLVTGAHFRAAHLTLRSGKNNPPFWLLDLGLVFVTAVSQTFEAATDMPLEEWTLAYGSAKETFSPNGITGPGSIIQGWNQVTNSENLLIAP